MATKLRYQTLLYKCCCGVLPWPDGEKPWPTQLAIATVDAIRSMVLHWFQNEHDDRCFYCDHHDYSDFQGHHHGDNYDSYSNDTPVCTKCNLVHRTKVNSLCMTSHISHITVRATGQSAADPRCTQQPNMALMTMTAMKQNTTIPRYRRGCES